MGDFYAENFTNFDLTGNCRNCESASIMGAGTGVSTDRDAAHALQEALKETDPNYDPEVKMLGARFSSPAIIPP